MYIEIGRSIIIRNNTTIPRKTIINDVVVLSFSNVAVAQACNIRKLLKIMKRFSSEQANISENALKAEDLKSRSHGFLLQL